VSPEAAAGLVAWQLTGVVHPHTQVPVLPRYSHNIEWWTLEHLKAQRKLTAADELDLPILRLLLGYAPSWDLYSQIARYLRDP